MIKFIIVFDSYLTRQIYLGLKLIETRCRDRNFLQSQGNGISRFPFYRIFIVPPPSIDPALDTVHPRYRKSRCDTKGGHDLLSKPPTYSRK